MKEEDLDSKLITWGLNSRPRTTKKTVSKTFRGQGELILEDFKYDILSL